MGVGIAYDPFRGFIGPTLNGPKSSHFIRHSTCRTAGVRAVFSSDVVGVVAFLEAREMSARLKF